MKQSNGFLWTDVAGLTLTAEDKEILAHPFISGVILFSRNYEAKAQLTALTQQIKSVSKDLIITVDQEGGRVQRFRTGFTELPSMEHWGSTYYSAKLKTEREFSALLNTMVQELRNTGVYSSLVPVLDINYDRNQVIGHRSFGDNQKIVIELSTFMIDQFHQLKMPVTGKHFPGHGWVTLDSHFHLPVDERSFETISQHDLQPFVSLSKKLDAIMLAHVVYENVDPNPVCFSRFWIEEILRKQLHFNGLVMCDDLSMQAMAEMGSYSDRANRALESGCDVLLVCNSREGTVDVLDGVLPLKNEDFARRLNHYSRFLA